MSDVRDSSLPLLLAGESLLLHPQRALIWPARRTLFAADLHLGKSDVFRRSGIPIPEGATATDLQRLEQVVSEHSLSRIVLLGDFLHAAAGDSAPQYAAAFTRWRATRPTLEFIVVAGNHDRRAADRPQPLRRRARRRAPLRPGPQRRRDRRPRPEKVMSPGQH